MKPLCLSALFSNFARLVQVHFRALNHIRSSLFLYFHDSRTEPSQTSLLWEVWCKARTQRDVMASRSQPWSSRLRSFQLFIQYSGRIRKFSWPRLQSATYALHVNRPPFSMPPTQFTQPFRWVTTSVHFFLNKCTFCYSIYATYAVFPLGNKLRAIYLMKKGHFLLCHTHNLYGMLKGNSCQYPKLIFFCKKSA